MTKKILLLSANLLVCGYLLQANEDFETNDISKQFLSKQNNNLSESENEKFILGKSFFRIPWVEAPSATTARDGLGPLFSANSCISCHPHNGAGTVFTKENQISRSLVTRFSIKDTIDFHNGFLPDTIYGSQLSINGIKDVKYEGKPKLHYKKIIEKYPDGIKVILSKPLIDVVDLNYGKLSSDTTITHRIAPALIGMGLIEKIQEKDILIHQDINDTNNDGISGKANFVYDRKSGTKRLGRFTWKASSPTLLQQTASAFQTDMGLTNSLYPFENCTSEQKECLDAPKSRDSLDVPDERLEAVAFYIANLKVPKPIVTKKTTKGKALFSKIGCADCHIPSYTLNNGSIISPYSDFLLHDMGSRLADNGRVEFDALPNEWRTQPLWGIGKRSWILKQTNYLHDGRAKTLEETILWHDGEAKQAKHRFKNLSKNERNAIIKFLGGL